MSTGVPTQQLEPQSTVRLRAGESFAERYVVEGLLGEGGMGAVYRVVDAELDETIALKLLRPEWASAPQALERFRREVKLARRVTHPNVARTFDLGAHNGVRFLTMELVEGDALSKVAGQGRRLPLAEALRIAAEVARGLAAAHAVGVVHRDLKPDNLLLARDGRVVITDFGIARLAEGAALANATRTVGGVIGTPAYMAPEQVEGRELDGRADIYALGIVLYEMLVGELPFVGDTVYALAAARLASEAPDPRAKVTDLPEAVGALVRKALGRRREDRPDAQELLREIELLRGGRIERAEPTRMVMSTPITSTMVTPSGPRTIAVLPSAGAAEGDLTQAVADALVAVKGARVLVPGAIRALALHATQASTHGTGSAGEVDAATIGRAAAADLVVDATIRTAGGRTRARMRLLEASTGAQLWAERYEGSVDDPFALEDAVVRGVAEAVKLQVIDESGRRGPSDPAAREAYRRARELYSAFAAPALREAIEILLPARASSPNDPWLMSALAAAQLRLWVLSGGADASLADAEELALRALATDSSIGETYQTIGILRLMNGETRAAVRAFQEAVARSPLLAEAHEYIGRLLCECGHPDEGLRRLDLAVRLDPLTVNGSWERARTFALLGDRARAEEAFARSLRVARFSMGQVFQKARLAMWWNDMAMVKELISELPQVTEAPPMAIGGMRAILEALASGASLADTVGFFRGAVRSLGSSPRQKAFFRQISVEFLGTAGLVDEALEELASAAELPLVDVLWMDRCPALDALRGDARFARARAIVAARAAEAWS